MRPLPFKGYEFELRQVRIPNIPPRIRYRKSLNTILFHRLSVAEDAKEIARWFNIHGPSAIRSRFMPYGMVIPRNQPEGKSVVIEQCFPLNHIGPHAFKMNTASYGIAVVGDFRKEKPTPKQTAACCWIALRLFDKLQQTANRDLLITTHGNVNNATSDPNKLAGGRDACPGDLFNPTLVLIRRALGKAGKIQ